MDFLFMVSGYSGTGKDEVCKALKTEFGALQLGMTDPARRHMMELYGWTEQQLFGPSSYRNAGDPRTPKMKFTKLDEGGFIEHNPDLSNENPEFFSSLREHMNRFPSSLEVRNFFLIPENSPLFKWDHGVLIQTENMVRSSRGWIFSDCDPQFFLSPREALQEYCEKMNQFYECTWVRSVFTVLNRISSTGEQYDRVYGFSKSQESNQSSLNHDRIYCLADLRHKHEMKYADSAIQSGQLRVIKIRVRRASVPSPPYQHRSETEQSEIPDSDFDFVIHNDGSLIDLYRTVTEVMRLSTE